MIFVTSTHNIKHPIEFEFNVSCEKNNDSESFSQLETPEISDEKNNDDTVLSPSNTEEDQVTEDKDSYWEQGNKFFFISKSFLQVFCEGLFV